MINPLKAPILRVLESCVSSSLLKIVDELKAQGYWHVSSAEHRVAALYRINFFVMNALYDLQRELHQEGLYLFVSPLSVYLCASTKSGTTRMDSSDSMKLAAFYLNWDNLTGVDEKEIQALLDSFWRDISCHEEVVQAYQLLGVEEGADKAVIRRAFRKKAILFHPDKGGDMNQYMKYRTAYERLRNID